MGVTTVIGRLPDERDEEAGAPPVALLSYGTWTSWFDRDPAVIGRTLTRHYGQRRQIPVTIVGVLAPGAFANPNDSSTETPAWASLDPVVMRERDDQGHELFFLRLSARLAPGVSLEVARAELAALTPQLVTDLPEQLAKTNPSLDAVLLRGQVGARVRTPLLAFLGAVCCLLLVASVNVASLVLARAMARRSEFATRFAQVTSGRWFTPADREGSLLVVVVNESMARKYWSDRTPIGNRLAYGRRSFQVIGVVSDVHNRGARVAVTPTFYLSTTQAPPDPVVLAIRTAPGLRGVEEGIAAQLSQVGNRIEAGYARRLEDYFWRQLADSRFLTLVVSIFTLLTLAVALVGLNGVLRFLVIHRTREMGIRKALGATSADLVKLVAGQALRFAIPECLIGMLAAAAVGPTIRSLLFGITPTDPFTLAMATVLLLLVVLVAAFFPARRASAVDPSALLRSE